MPRHLKTIRAVLPVIIVMAGKSAWTNEHDVMPSNLYQRLAEQSHPVVLELRSLTNPWGERLEPLNQIPPNFGERVVTAAQVYADQKIRYDGYLGSDDDGMFYFTAADGLDNAYYANDKTKSYTLSANGVVDDLRERVWVCLDYPIHTLSLAGFPLREAMIADWEAGSREYTGYGRWPENRPTDHWYFRRVTNLVRYLKQRQQYWEARITQEQYRDPRFRPLNPFRPGDIIIMGHYGDADPLGPWFPKHSGIVKTVDDRGLPVELFNMRVSQKMVDTYDGVIDQTRPGPEGEGTRYYRHFSDRYSLVGHGRIVNAFAVSGDAVPIPYTSPYIMLRNEDFIKLTD